MRKSSINGQFSIAMFDYWRVSSASSSVNSPSHLLGATAVEPPLLTFLMASVDMVAMPTAQACLAQRQQVK